MSLGNIVLVDDEPSLLKLIATYLTRLGYEVRTCTRTDEAWRVLEPDPEAFDALLLDMTMPGLSAVALGVRALLANPRMAVIASSGYPTDLRSLEEAGPGRVRFLHKPYTPEMLADAIKAIRSGQTG